MEIINMAYSDHIIKPVLIKLSQDGTVTFRKVSEITCIPESTIRNSVDRMLQNGMIQREGKGKKGGYRYFETRNAISA